MWRTFYAVVLAVCLVRIVEAQSNEDPSRSYAGFIESDVTNLTPFVGEPIVYTFRFYFAGLTEDNRYTPPNFLGFGQRMGSENRTTEVVNGEQFTVFTESTVLIPTRAGEVTIGSAYITVPEVNRPRQKQSGHTLETPPIEVNVRPLPSVIPSRHSGAVGQFATTATIENTIFRAGEPFLLRLTVEGSGNLEQALPPELDLPATWRHFSRPSTFETTGLLTGIRTFEWFVIPNQPGQQEMPSIQFTYFDPQIEAFQTATTEPIEVIVEEAFVAIEVQPTSVPTPTRPPSAFELRPMSADISAQSTQPGGFFWFLWIIPPLVTAAIWLLFRDKKDVDVTEHVNKRDGVEDQLTRVQSGVSTRFTSRQRPVTMKRRLKHDMQLALENPDAKQAFEQILSAVLRYLSRKVGQKVTLDNITETLSYLPDDVHAEIRDCLEMAASGRYAPVNKDDVRVLVKLVLGTMVSLDKQSK